VLERARALCAYAGARLLQSLPDVATPSAAATRRSIPRPQCQRLDRCRPGGARGRVLALIGIRVLRRICPRKRAEVSIVGRLERPDGRPHWFRANRPAGVTPTSPDVDYKTNHAPPGTARRRLPPMSPAALYRACCRSFIPSCRSAQHYSGPKHHEFMEISSPRWTRSWQLISKG